MKKTIKLGHIEMGDGLPTFLIAEIGLNHNGSITLAKEHMESAAKSGASFLKFQKRSPEDLAAAWFLDQPFPKCPLFGSTQREVRTKLELSKEQLRELKNFSEELKLPFFLSVFDAPSLKVAQELEVPVLKVASHSITNLPLLKQIAQAGIPVMASLGASSWEERDRAVEVLKKVPLILMHCVSAYPCPDQLVKLDTIGEIRKRYDALVGFSGHEDGIELSVAAATLGACVIEKHFTLNKAMIGLDHGISLEPQEFSELSRRIRRVEKARGVVTGVLPEELPARNNYHVAVFAKADLAEGTVLSEKDLVCKQPLQDASKYFLGYEFQTVVGKRLKAKIAKDQPIGREVVG